MDDNNYAVEINFTNDQLATIYQAQASVVVGKIFSSSSSNVAWQVFKPMQKNTLTWIESYGIYASTCSLCHGAPIVQRTGISGASTGKLYTLSPDGAIGPPQDGGEEGIFMLKNSYPEKKIMTVGLYQDASLNGELIAGNAISATPVMLSHTASMKPKKVINIWIQSHIKSNTVVSRVASPMTPLLFDSEKRSLIFSYDDNSGKFVPY
ncbi:hypothetical protein [Cellvibrio sp.]|jgi:hypothetical protein